MGCCKSANIKDTTRYSVGCIGSSELGKKEDNKEGDKGENFEGDKGENFASQVKQVEDNKEQKVDPKEEEVDSKKESIRIPDDIQDAKDKPNIARHEQDEERPSKRLEEGVKIGTEEERLEIIEYFLRLGYEIPLILDCEKTCGSDKDRIINYIDTRLRH